MLLYFPYPGLRVSFANKEGEQEWPMRSSQDLKTLSETQLATMETENGEMNPTERLREEIREKGSNGNWRLENKRVDRT